MWVRGALAFVIDALDILPHLSLTAAALVSGKKGDSFYAACKD
jgi:hypothetical protein